ncbi:YdcF family protein [Alcanivorax sp. S6407]|uniref:YdcF family protein n=1 Tax=Alcanivorax sp. S6407 TaxID=2926424 RepID=UPI001FF6234D|nr:YdcF family protein [Alcanivorax sp. S6407]MCK0153255.1 YdcF family protein [Alcanivorax sp. S6407]
MALTWLALMVLVGATLPAIVRGFLPPLPRRNSGITPQAVVVLGAGRRQHNGRFSLTTRGLRRLQLAARLAHEHGLPLVVSGGLKKAMAAREPSESELMAEQVRRRWPHLTVLQENESRNTWENAVKTAELLADQRIDEVILVSDRTHLPRALLCFQSQGVLAEAAWQKRLPKQAWRPSAGALTMVPEIWYEWLALVWYHLRYL